MVGGELRFVTACVALRPAGGSGTVDQNMERAFCDQPAVDECVDRGGVHQIEPIDLGARDAGERGCGAIRIARSRGHRRAGLAQRAGDFQADAGGTAGNDHVLARQVDGGENLIGG